MQSRDTSPEMAALYHDLLMRKSGIERMLMALRMFDSARAIVRASLVAQGYVEPELTVQIFLRTYGRDFDAAQRDAIVAHLRARAIERLRSAGTCSADVAQS